MEKNRIVDQANIPAGAASEQWRQNVARQLAERSAAFEEFMKTLFNAKREPSMGRATDDSDTDEDGSSLGSYSDYGNLDLD